MPRHRDCHQRIDVQTAMPQGCKPLLVDVKTCQPYRDPCYGEASGAPDCGFRSEVPDNFGSDSQEQRGSQLGQLASDRIVVVTIAFRVRIT
jgi:hypothetical protein